MLRQNPGHHIELLLNWTTNNEKRRFMHNAQGLETNGGVVWKQMGYNAAVSVIYDKLLTDMTTFHGPLYRKSDSLFP